MVNRLIVLANPATVISDFNNLINPGTHVLFVILGDNAQSHQLAQVAAPYGQDHRLIAHVTVSGHLMPDLTARAKAPYLSSTPANQWATLGVAFDGTVAEFQVSYSADEIEPTLLLAEAY
jgi:hypothetical protein